MPRKEAGTRSRERRATSDDMVLPCMLYGATVRRQHSAGDRKDFFDLEHCIGGILSW